MRGKSSLGIAEGRTVGQAGDHNGSRLARARHRRRWSQDRLARETGFSVSAVRAFEQGRRSLDSMRQLLLFARVLDVPVTDLTGQPYLPSTPDQDAGHGAVAGIRRELMLAGRPAKPTVAEAAAVSVPALRDRTDDIHARHRSAALSRMGESLPGLLQDLRVALEVSPPAHRPVVYRLLARTYEAAMDMLLQSGYLPDSVMAIERARWAAQQSDDVLCRKEIDWHYAMAFLRVGELDQAADLMDEGLRDLRPLVSERVEAAALTGMYELQAALICARGGDPVTLWERWQRAYDIGQQVGVDRGEPLQFGPSNVAIWSVSLPVEMLDGATAVKRAEQASPALGKLTPAAVITKGQYSAQRLGMYWVDVGRAHLYRADHDRALKAVLKAERIAPQPTRNSPPAREVVSHLLRTRRQTDLIELSLRMGL
jgi:transcriptional regulator with XRE-family HTH domain